MESKIDGTRNNMQEYDMLWHFAENSLQEYHIFHDLPRIVNKNITLTRNLVVFLLRIVYKNCSQ